MVAITGAGISLAGGGITYSQLAQTVHPGDFESDDFLRSYVRAMHSYKPSFSHYALRNLEAAGKDFDSYDRILIGFPIWYSKCPQLVLSFISQYDFSKKDVYPFCTSGMSGPETAVEQLKKACAGANVHLGLRLNKIDEEAVRKWLDGGGK
ncbi:MAG: hypothetical protein LUC90_04030 [Lachnospiraceae bacterium]|nr:hypothetical protein [Lachnospiraceae bacterium]